MDTLFDIATRPTQKVTKREIGARILGTFTSQVYYMYTFLDW